MADEIITRNWITLQELADIKGKLVGDLTIGESSEFWWYESKSASKGVITQAIAQSGE